MEEMMKTIDCEARVLPDGHLVLPPEVAEKIKVKPDAIETRRIIIFEKNGQPTSLGRFCGAWKDERDADDIIEDIMADRRKNLRSEEMNRLK
jgi:hypothetical protein